MKSVYCAVRTGSLNKAVCASYLKGNIRTCNTLYVTSVADVILYISASQQVFNLVYELPEDFTDVPKHVRVVKDRALKSVCSFVALGIINDYSPSLFILTISLFPIHAFPLCISKDYLLLSFSCFFK